MALYTTWRCHEDDDDEDDDDVTEKTTVLHLVFLPQMLE